MTKAKTQKTPQEYFKSINDVFNSLPKTPVQAKEVFEKVQSVVTTELKNSMDVFNIYKKVPLGDATPTEIAAANKMAAELVKATTFATLLAIPGSLFVLPAIVEKAKEYNIDMVPASVSAMFDI